MSMEETFKQLLSFQIASALECAGEPNSYDYFLLGTL